MAPQVMHFDHVVSELYTLHIRFPHIWPPIDVPLRGEAEMHHELEERGATADQKEGVLPEEPCSLVRL